MSICHSQCWAEYLSLVTYFNSAQKKDAINLIHSSVIKYGTIKFEPELI